MNSDTHLPDIQSLDDDRNIPLNRVGIKGLRWPITVLDRANGTQQTTATVNLYVNLPHHFRGTHMSRFVEVLNEYRDANWINRISEILHRIRDTLEASEAHMEVEFEYFIDKQAPVSKQSSWMSYLCRFNASFQKTDDFVIGVTVPVTTLCPCSKEISCYGAHNQRCNVSLNVRYKDFVWLEDMIEIVESCASGGMYSILKRPDEKYVTEHAYENPKFVEDIVREIAVRLDDVEHITWYRIEADSEESIHNHNAYALVERSKS